MVVSVAAVLLTWLLALPIGIYSAVRPYSPGDYVATFLGLFSDECVEAPWTLAKTWDLLKHLPLPATILGLAGTAQLIRIMRANLLDELGKPYVMTARARGLS